MEPSGRNGGNPWQMRQLGNGSHAIGLLVLTLAGSQIRAVTLIDKSVLGYVGLLRSLPD